MHQGRQQKSQGFATSCMSMMMMVVVAVAAAVVAVAVAVVVAVVAYSNDCAFVSKSTVLESDSDSPNVSMAQIPLIPTYPNE